MAKKLEQGPTPTVEPMPESVPYPEELKRFKVRATALGYYDDKRRRFGDVFWVSSKKNDKGQYVEFSESWMERVPDETPEQITTGKQELRRQHDEIFATKAAGALAASGESPSMRNPLDD